MALIIVLLVLALMLMVVGEFSLAMRLEGTTTLNFRAGITAGYLAEAAYQRAVAEILPEALAQQLDEEGLLVFRRAIVESPKAPSRRELALGPGRFSYRITDEEGRLNINRAPPELLHRLLSQPEFAIERDARDVIVDSIMDWRDPNEEHRLNGAESDYYLGLPAPYRSKNADFDSLEELLQVRGVTPALFYGTQEPEPGKCRGLAGCLTIAGTGAVNLNTASDTVLRTMGFGEAEITLLKQGRPYLNLTTLGTQLRGRGGRQTTRSDTFRIEATGEVPGQGRRTLVAIVQRQAGQDGMTRARPLYWRWADEEQPRP